MVVGSGQIEGLGIEVTGGETGGVGNSEAILPTTLPRDCCGSVQGPGAKHCGPGDDDVRQATENSSFWTGSTMM